MLVIMMLVKLVDIVNTYPIQMSSSIDKMVNDDDLQSNIKRKDFYVNDIENVIQSKHGPVYKRHLFISDGWGPGGKSLKVDRFKSQNRTSQSKMDNKNEFPRQNNRYLIVTGKKGNNPKKYYSLRWSIPGLFGQF
ncbi:hypothetical protein BLOT_015767 [Blomia tropicalis]|nr:hypothetical protein BLOT_015767 [Blomia tropicalis]